MILKAICNHCNKFGTVYEVGKFYLCNEHKLLKQYQPKGVKKPKRVNHISVKRKDENKIYIQVRDKYLNENEFCECCSSDATEIHHKAKTNSGLLTDTFTFMAICRSCHTEVHSNHSYALENGFIWDQQQINDYLKNKI
jgi:hypothetical protein